MVLIAVAFIAGLLTVFAPCVLPVLPVVLGTTVTGRRTFTPYVVVGALGVSIVTFTFFLKTAILGAAIDPLLLQIISGTILALLGVGLLLSQQLQALRMRLGVHSFAERMMGKGIHAGKYWGDVLAGIALGPIFASCSPTYFLILAVILPVSLMLGTGAIVAYVFGLSLMLLLIALFSERIIRMFSFSEAAWRQTERIIGMLFIILGILIALGLMKRIEVYVLSTTPFDISELEYRFLKYLPSSL